MKPNIIQMLSSIALAASLIFIPNLARELGVTDSEIGVISAVYGFAAFASSYIFGRATDIYDRKSIIHLGLLFSTIAFFIQVLTDPYFVAPLWSFSANPLNIAITSLGLLFLVTAMRFFSVKDMFLSNWLHVHQPLLGTGSPTSQPSPSLSSQTSSSSLIEHA